MSDSVSSPSWSVTVAGTRFQELAAWQRARELTCMIYEVTNAAGFLRNLVLRDQTHRSPISVTANIAEGFARNRPGEFLRFLDIAQGSCAELHSHPYVALNRKYLSGVRFHDLEEAATGVGALFRRRPASVERSRATRDGGRET